MEGEVAVAGAGLIREAFQGAGVDEAVPPHEAGVAVAVSAEAGVGGVARAAHGGAEADQGGQGDPRHHADLRNQQASRSQRWGDLQ